MDGLYLFTLIISLLLWSRECLHVLSVNKAPVNNGRGLHTGYRRAETTLMLPTPGALKEEGSNSHQKMDDSSFTFQNVDFPVGYYF